VEFGESAIKDDMVKEYLPEAFAFIYVINSVSPGGIQLNRVRESLNNFGQYTCRNKSKSVVSLVC